MGKDHGGPPPSIRRGGIAERGRGSAPCILEHMNHDEAEDSGYHSDTIDEDIEETDPQDIPLSPRTRAPSTIRKKRYTERNRVSSNRDPSLKRRASWQPNLKRDLKIQDASVDAAERDTVDLIIAMFDAYIKFEPEVDTHVMENRNGKTVAIMEPISTDDRICRRQKSTLLHPSSPTILESTATLQAFTQPNIVQVRPASTPKQSPARRPGMPPRKKSSLLHPSSPTLDTSAVRPQLKTILSVLPRRHTT